jgi:hypothetical protein
MSGYKRVPPEWPWWVRLSLLGTKSRRALWAWTWASLALGVVLVVVGLWINRPFYAVLGAIGGPWAAAMYWLTVRWIDQHGSWDQIK